MKALKQRIPSHPTEQVRILFFITTEVDSIVLCSDENDFDNTVITATFAADAGGNPTTDLNVPIPVFDDDIDEADDQIFIAQLVVVSAVNRGLITIERDASNCIIVDNDREYNNVESTLSHH